MRRGTGQKRSEANAASAREKPSVSESERTCARERMCPSISKLGIDFIHDLCREHQDLNHKSLLKYCSTSKFASSQVLQFKSPDVFLIRPFYRGCQECQNASRTNQDNRSSQSKLSDAIKYAAPFETHRTCVVPSSGVRSPQSNLPSVAVGPFSSGSRASSEDS